MKYRISRVIPLRFSSVYSDGAGTYFTSWWQWRDRLWGHEFGMWKPLD